MTAPAERAALEAEALLDATVDAVVIIDHRGHIETFNRAAERLFGYRAEEVRGRNVGILMTDRDRAAHDGYMARYLESGIPHIIGIGREVEARRKDGSVFPVFLSVGRIRSTEPPRFVGYLRDITMRRSMIAELQRERDRAQQYLDVAEVILLALDPEGRVTMINRKGSGALGRAEAEVSGLDWFELAVAAEDRVAARGGLETLRALPPGAAHSLEYRIQGAGGELHVIAWRSIALRDPQGSIIGFLCSGEDVTERRQAEAEALRAQERMTHVSRLTTMGEMAAGIAHEINQPLAAITSYAQACDRLLALPRPDIAEVREALRGIAAQALRAGEIIRRLRSLVRNRETEREATDVNDLIEDVLPLGRHDASLHDVRISLELAPGLPRVSTDRIQVQQVVLNLLRNAIEALAEQRGEPREITVSTGLATPGAVEIRVCDNGPGVDESIAERMFDPFCTTKVTGTGLGLAISRTIVQAHRGELGYCPVRPHGACFYVRLPLNGEDMHS